ncbi:P-loop containing nucleoside triphosphate hydrolase protein [Diaporthe sp. PMI_573]|nr:P-loop containing nucleoside triphosphate hydrolase protein [Diaporthaceae sp. PMI_573]
MLLPAHLSSSHDPLKFIEDCVAELPQHMNDLEEGLYRGTVLGPLIQEIYSELVLFCGRIIRFFHSNNHAQYVKQQWDTLIKDSAQTKTSIASHSKKIDDEWRSRKLPDLIDQEGRQLKEMMAQMNLERNKSSSTPTDCIPQILNQFFEGRARDLSALQKYLEECRNSEVFTSIAISGFPGAGKTSLALHLAYACKNHVPRQYFPVLWITAAGPDKIDQDVIRITTELGILPEGTHPAELRPRAKKELRQWLASSENNRWVVIFDNVSAWKDIESYWPQAKPGCATIVTSRNHAIGGTAISHRWRVEPLNFEDTAELMLSILGPGVPRSQENIAAAQEIGKELGGLPLAVTQIASYILENGAGLRNFLPLYRKRWKKIHRSHVDLPDYQDYQDTLTNIWLLFLQNIEEETKILEEIVAFLQPDHIPMSFFTSEPGYNDHERPDLTLIQDEIDFLEAKRALERGALLQSDTETGDLRIHRLIQAVVLDSMKKGEICNRFEDAVTVVQRAFPQVTSALVPNAYKSDKWHLAQRCLPHVWNLDEIYQKHKVSLETGSVFPQLLSDTSWYLYETGQFERAKLLLGTAEDVCSENIALRASTRSIRALIYHHQNFQKDAMGIWEENLALRRKMHGEEHFLVGQNLCNLGAAYGELRDMENCRDYFTRGREHREKYHPGHISDLALHDCNFTSYLIHNGDLKEAEVTIQRSIARYRQCEDDEGFGYNQALFFLAKLRTAQKEYSEASVIHTRVLRVRRKIMSNHYYTCVSFYHTADVSDLVGDHKTAM